MFCQSSGSNKNLRRVTNFVPIIVGAGKPCRTSAIHNLEGRQSGDRFSGRRRNEWEGRAVGAKVGGADNRGEILPGKRRGRFLCRKPQGYKAGRRLQPVIGTSDGGRAPYRKAIPSLLVQTSSARPSTLPRVRVVRCVHSCAVESSSHLAPAPLPASPVLCRKALSPPSLPRLACLVVNALPRAALNLARALLVVRASSPAVVCIDFAGR